jgi:hypothetical protein
MVRVKAATMTTVRVKAATTLLLAKAKDPRDLLLRRAPRVPKDTVERDLMKAKARVTNQSQPSNL